MRQLFLTVFALIPSLAFAAPGENLGIRQSTSEPSLIATATQMIDLRAQSLGLYAPLPPAEDVTREVVVSKLAALASAYTYSNQILVGLSASGGTPGMQQQLADQFAPARERFDRLAGDVLMQLLTSPVVSAHGWIVSSQFGGNAERQALALLSTLRSERPFLAALQTRLDKLAGNGEISMETMNAISQLLDQSSVTHNQVGLSPE